MKNIRGCGVTKIFFGYISSHHYSTPKSQTEISTVALWVMQARPDCDKEAHERNNKRHL